MRIYELLGVKVFKKIVLKIYKIFPFLDYGLSKVKSIEELEKYR